MNNQDIHLKAFLSCSLRIEDEGFNHFITEVLRHPQIQIFGTVGKYDCASENPAETMRKNIEAADFIVIAATPRYFQKDIKTGNSFDGLSEMIHVEAGLAYASKKPIVVFVQKGTNVGNFLPNVTQYIELDGTQEDLTEKWNLICALLNDVLAKSVQNREQKSNSALWNLFKGGLAVVGGIKVVEYLVGDYDNAPVKRKRTSKSVYATAKSRNKRKSY